MAVPRRAECSAIVEAVESRLGRGWDEMTEGHGDWGRDGTMAVSRRHLGRRLAEVVRRVPGVSYAAAARHPTILAAGRGTAGTGAIRLRLAREMSIVNV